MQKSKCTTQKYSKITQVYYDSDIKWYYELGKYNNTFYKINLLRMYHKIVSRLSKHPRREKSDQFTQVMMTFLQRTTAATKIKR